MMNWEEKYGLDSMTQEERDVLCIPGSTERFSPPIGHLKFDDILALDDVALDKRLWAHLGGAPLFKGESSFPTPMDGPRDSIVADEDVKTHEWITERHRRKQLFLAKLEGMSPSLRIIADWFDPAYTLSNPVATMQKDIQRFQSDAYRDRLRFITDHKVAARAVILAPRRHDALLLKVINKRLMRFGTTRRPLSMRDIIRFDNPPPLYRLYTTPSANQRRSWTIKSVLQTYLLMLHSGADARSLFPSLPRDGLHHMLTKFCTPRAVDLYYTIHPPTRGRNPATLR